MLTPLISVAPMMNWTDRHCRYFHRLLAKNVVLYTEMIPAGICFNPENAKAFEFNSAEHPLALQLGGSDPAILSRTSKIGVSHGYDEINLNVGCPSDRVSSGHFGACLMLEPELVARCVEEMQAAVTVPVTVKCRIGVDDNDSYEALCHFISTVHQAGCKTFIVHARKAWLKGLSPKENREIPPLHYESVYRLKKDFPHIRFIINGGITTLEQMEEHLKWVDGVMIGREAYHHPYFLAQIDKHFYARESLLTRQEVLHQFINYIDDHLKQGAKLHQMTRHILGLFNGLPGARQWRRYLSEHSHHPKAGIEVVVEASKFV